MNTDKEDFEFEKKILEMKIPLTNFLSEEEKETSWKEILLSVNKTISNKPIMQPIHWMAAAAFLFIIGLSISVWINLDNSFKTNNHEKLNVSLADGSSVTLNYESKLKLSKNFGGQNRQVFLEGEAFFNIHRDELHPFVIRVGQHEVIVLGTSFNVRHMGKVTEVSVRSGKVQLRSENSFLILETSEKGQISSTGELLKLPWDANDFSWYSGTLILKEKSLREVAAILSKLFDRRVEVAPSIASCTLSAKIEYETIEGILNVINETLGTEWRNDANTIYIYGKGC